MEIPLGKSLGEDMDLEAADFTQLIPKLKNASLSGYLALTIMSKNGTEEGLLLFDEGAIIAAEYEYFSQNITVSGDRALPLVLNASTASGVFDIFELSAEELKGAQDSNPSSLLKVSPDDKDIASMIPASFTEIGLELKSKEKKEIKAQIQKSDRISKEAVLEKYGISTPDPDKVEELLSEIGV